MFGFLTNSFIGILILSLTFLAQWFSLVELINKTDHKGIGMLVPFYNMILLSKVVYKKSIYGLLMIIPLVGQIIYMITLYKFARMFKFNKGLCILFALQIQIIGIYIPFIGIIAAVIMAFSNHSFYVINDEGVEVPVKFYRHSFFYYLNPRNLTGEVKKYGYSFTIGKAVLTIIGSIAILLILKFVFRVQFIYLAILFTIDFCVMLTIIRESYRSMYENTRFSDVNTYIEQFLYSFKRNPKILNALNDIALLFPSGPMREAIDAAINHITNAPLSATVTRDALSIIEEKYPCGRLRNMHKFAIRAEENGGNVEVSTDLLLNDRALWAKRYSQTQEAKKNARNTVVASMIMALIVCASILYITSDIDLSQSIVYQLSTVAIVSIDLLLFGSIQKKITTKMFDDGDNRKELAAYKDYQALKKYDEIKERNTSFLLGGIVIVIGFLLLLVKFKLFGIITILAGIGLAFIYKLVYKLRVSSVVDEIKDKFPSWLMEVSLLTQYNNVFTSFRITENDAPIIFRDDLHELIEAIEKEPESIKPYIEFLGMFNLTDVSSAMKMFYSIAAGTGGDSAEQTKNLIERNTELVDKVEQERMKNEESRLTSMLFIPTLTGSLKLTIDMTVLLVMYMGLISSVGI